MQATAVSPIRHLDERDINAILARNFIGRLAFTRGDGIDVLPLYYVYADGSIYGRTAVGGKLSAIDPAGTPVAFQVDEVQSMSCWQSVLVHGMFLTTSAHSGQEEALRALGAIRRLDRFALRENDPSPHRTEIFRIAIQNSTGRAMG